MRIRWAQTHLVTGEVRGVIGRIGDILDALVERAVRRVIEALHVALAAPTLKELVLLAASLSLPSFPAHLLTVPVAHDLGRALVSRYSS